MTAAEREDTDPDSGIDASDLMSAFADALRQEIEGLEGLWTPDPERLCERDVVLAILSRQAVLARDLAAASSTWTPHIAPIVLRAMVDNHINLAWILGSPSERAKLFVAYGLGQLKLVIQHREYQLRSAGQDPKEDGLTAHWKAWLEGERYEFLTEVSIASWSGKSTREMAEEAGCLDFYSLAYLPFSGAAHSQWHHIAQFNSRPCESVLHPPHRVPWMPECAPDAHYLFIAAKYFEKSIRAAVSVANVNRTWERALRVIIKGLKDAVAAGIHKGSSGPDDAASPQDGGAGG